jgi:hypothetical protein
MNHRHLLPDEIDLLLDDEVGFGVAPLKAHIRDCDHCRAQVDEARLIVDALEDVPHFAPSHTFTDRVLAQVPVFVPRTSRPGYRRPMASTVAAGTVRGRFGDLRPSIVTVVMLWIATQTDVVAMATGVAATRSGSSTMRAAVLSTVFGEQFFAIIQRMGPSASRPRYSAVARPAAPSPDFELRRFQPSSA